MNRFKPLIMLATAALLLSGCSSKDTMVKTTTMVENTKKTMMPMSRNVVQLKDATDPTIAFRIAFLVGSQNDPAGKEGIAAITATMLTEGATQNHTYEEILAKLYPMAAGISESVDKEMTVFSGRTHKDNLDEYYALFKEVLLQPAFAQEDFDRVKSDYLNYVQKALRYSQDEELGKEVLYEFIFKGTPYEHNEEGYVKSLQALTLQDVKDFYAANYTQSNMLLGLGGGYSASFLKKVEADFKALPEGSKAMKAKPQVTAIDGMHVKIVEKNANSTAISFGFPIDVQRGSREFYALDIARSWLGEHRNSFSHLYEVIREIRGLNYGDYAYIEHFPNGGRRSFPQANVARSQQVFQIWIRPVPNEARVFAFRAALRELQMLVDNGMSEEDFTLTKKFLKSYNLHYATTNMKRLADKIDDRFYGIKEGHWKRYSKSLDTITRAEVNAALKKHLNYKNLKAVFITRDAEDLKKTLTENLPSPIEYSSDKPAEVLEEDKEIINYPLMVKPDNVVIQPVEAIFEG
ncbi:MAG: M16 family metallopeptidase [Calditrichia bacterium]